MYTMDTRLQILRPRRQPPDASYPLFMDTVPAGFPSPADDYIDGKLDLNSHLIKHPAATYFVRAAGDSMLDAGIHDGDILVVDRAVEPRNDSVVIATVDGELTVKRLRKSGAMVMLVPGNSSYEPLSIDGDTRFEIWGVVITVIHRL